MQGVVANGHEAAGTPRKALQASQAGWRLFEGLAAVLAVDLDGGSKDRQQAARALDSLISLGGGITLQLARGSTSVPLAAAGDSGHHTQQLVLRNWWRQQEAPPPGRSSSGKGGSGWRRVVVVMGACTPAVVEQLREAWQTTDVVSSSWVMDSIVLYNKQLPTADYSPVAP
jgi:hypothetical protein